MVALILLKFCIVCSMLIARSAKHWCVRFCSVLFCLWRGYRDAISAHISFLYWLYNTMYHTHIRVSRMMCFFRSLDFSFSSFFTCIVIWIRLALQYTFAISWFRMLFDSVRGWTVEHHIFQREKGKISKGLFENARQKRTDRSFITLLKASIIIITRHLKFHTNF